MARSIFRPGGSVLEVEVKDFSEGLVNSVDPTLVPDNALTGGQNTRIKDEGTIESRDGISLYGNFLGTTTGILGGFDFVNRNGTQERLTVWNTGVYRDVAGVWTLLTGGTTLTTNLPADGDYFPITNKFYIINGTNHAQVYTSGTTIAEDTSFKKGKYIRHFQNRLLVAGVSGEEDVIWYTDLGVDTFSANNYFKVSGEVTGIEAYYDKVLIFTKKKIYRLQNFTFDGVAAGPEAVIELPVDFGQIYDRTSVILNNFLYFLGQDITNKASIYKCDGYKAVTVSEPRVAATMASLATSQLENACAVADGIFYRLHVAESGQTTNNLGILYDTVRGIFMPPERRYITGRADFSCLWTSETSGQWEVYAGTQGTGQVYKLNTGNYYDELAEERYLTLGTNNIPVDANPAKRAAQSFQMTQYTAAQTASISKVILYLKKISGTTTDLQLRIETDSNGLPSGTAVDNGTATITAFSDTSYVWKTVSFSTAPELTGGTTYWLVLKHVTEGTGSSKYSWLGDSCTPTYAYGNLATYSTNAGGATETYNPSAGAISGTVNRPTTNETWDTIHDSTGTGQATGDVAAEIQAGTTTDRWNQIRRGIIMFDTSAIPDGATITSAQLSLYPTYVAIEGNFSTGLTLTSATPDSTTSFEVDDYLSTRFGSTRFIDNDMDANAMTVNSYNTYELNASGISAIDKSGITKFGLRWEEDLEDSEPLWSSGDYIDVNFQGYGNTNPPRLIVTYTLAGTPAWSADTLTDQAFGIYAQTLIETEAQTKLFSLGGLGKEYHLHRFMSQFNTTGDYAVLIGFDRGQYATSQSFLISLSSGSSSQTWGGGGVWGSGLVWGGEATRNFLWTTVFGFTGRLLRLTVGNKGANQPWKFDGAMLALTRRIRQA